MTSAELIGLDLRGIRRSAGLKQRALAERLGVSQQFISKIERHGPRSVDVLIRFVEACGHRVLVKAGPLLPHSAPEMEGERPTASSLLYGPRLPVASPD